MKSVRSNFGLRLYNYIYTDFIDNVGPIMNELNSHGIDSVVYYGEMDIKSQNESYRKWRNVTVK